MGRKTEAGNEKVTCKTPGQNIRHSPFEPQTVVWKLLAGFVLPTFPLTSKWVNSQCNVGIDMGQLWHTQKESMAVLGRRGAEAMHRIALCDGQE